MDLAGNYQKKKMLHYGIRGISVVKATVMTETSNTTG